MKSVHIRIFLWSVFSSIQTESGDLWNKSPDSVRIQGNTDQKKLFIWTLFTQSALFLKEKKNLQNFSPFRNDVSIRFHAFHILGLGAERNTEIMKTVRIFNTCFNTVVLKHSTSPLSFFFAIPRMGSKVKF